MKRALKLILPVVAVLAVLAVGAWYFLSFNPNMSTNFLRNRAEAMAEQGRYQRAVKYYDLAWKLSPEDTTLPAALAQTYISSGNYTKAEYVLVQAITAAPSNTELYKELCQTYIDQDKILDAVQMLDRIADPQVKADLDALRPAAPTVLPESGYYTEYISVTVDSDSPAVYVTTDGEFPSLTQDQYSEPITLSGGETTVTAVALDPETGLVSPAVLCGYTIGGVVEPVTLSDNAVDTAVRAVLNKQPNDQLLTSDLWGITTLTLEQPADLSDLAHCTGLRSLTVQNVSGLDFTVLSKHLNLEYLDLSGCTISTNSLQTIGTLTRLKTLKLSSCALTTIETLAQLTALTELDISSNVVDNVGVLSLMLELETVNLSNNPITSIAGLSACKKLQTLDIANCDVASLASLNDKTQLQTLLASNNKIVSLEDLENCAALETLDIQANLVNDISVLPALEKLTVFLADNNQITVVPVFDPEVCALQQFSIDYNQVEDISGLKDLQHLNYFNADYNKIQDLSPLSQCLNLVQVNVWDNPVTTETVEALRAFDIIVTYNSEYKPET